MSNLGHRETTVATLMLPPYANKNRLRFLWSKLTAIVGDEINCNESEDVGLSTQNQLDNMSEATIGRNGHAKTIDDTTV